MSVQPTPRLLVLVLVVCLLASAGDWSPIFTWAAITGTLILATLLAADWRVSPGPDAWTVERRCEKRLSLAASNTVRVNVRLRRGPRRLRVWVRDEVPASFAIVGDRRVLTAVVRPRLTTKLTYAVRPPRRGSYSFGDVHLRWESVLGLFRRQTGFESAQPVQVYPNLVDIRKYDLLLRRNRLWELGLRRTRFLGRGTEFERLREYRADDDYRRINWPATARRGTPITNEYETERSQTVVALLDVGRLMRSPVGDVAKLDFCINAVLMLAYVATKKGDRVGALTFSDHVERWLAPRAGRGQFHLLLDHLYAVESSPVEPDYAAAFNELAARLNKRSLVVTFTDVVGGLSLDVLVAHMTAMRRRHLPLLVTISDPTVLGLATQPITGSASLYQRTVAEGMMEERTLTLERLRRGGVLTLDVPANELTVAVVNRYLELKARTRL